MIPFGDSGFNWWRVWNWAWSAVTAMLAFAVTAGLAFLGYSWVVG